MDEDFTAKLNLLLDILVNENNTSKASQNKSKEEQFLNIIEQNIAAILERTSKDECFSRILNSYIHHPIKLTNIGDRLWNFTLLCLLLLKAFSEALLAKEQRNSTLSGISSNKTEPLILNQEKILKKCVQFVVALGILPNLIPSVKNILKGRIRSVLAIENLDVHSSVQQKYYRLLVTVTVLLECLKQEPLQSVIFYNHSCDLLAALFVLCYAPIKKIPSFEDTKDSSKNRREADDYDKYENFHWFMTKLRACDSYSDKDFIDEMWQDRKYFQLCLQKFMNQIPHELLLWQLLFLQGISFGTKCKTKKNLKVPVWLLNICNNLFTTKILEPSGMKCFVQMVFEPVIESQNDQEELSIEKINAVAKVISHNPAKHISLDVYMQEIAKQIKDLLSTKNAESSQVFASVASCVVLQFAERNLTLCESVVSRYLFEPFWHCLDTDKNHTGSLIATEEEITTCIEGAYEIFVNYQSALTDEPLNILSSFYHLLFSIYVKLLNSVSFLKRKVEDLMLCILNHHTQEETLKLLKLASFEDTRIPKVPLARHLKIEFGDAGGVQVTQSDGLEENIEVKCQAITQLLNKVSDRKVKTLFFLSLIRKSIDMDEKDDPDYIQKDDVDHFVDVLIAVHLLESLSENIGEDLIEDVEEAVKLIKAALECIDTKKKKNEAFSEETVMTFLVILSTLISYKDQLTSRQWEVLKTCVSPLQNLMEGIENPILTQLSDNICTTILTRGAATDNNQSASMKSPETELKQQHQSQKLIEEIENLVMTDCKSVQGLKGSSSRFQTAMTDSKDASVPVRGHGLISLAKLIAERDEETLLHKEEIFEMLQKSLADEDSYVYLAAIRGLSVLGEVYTEKVLPILLSEFTSKTEDWSYTLKIGEALLNICRNLNEMTPKFRERLLNTYLCGVRHQDLHIRASSLSNLGEVCKALKFSIGPMLQELLLCVTSVVKTDPAVEVRRAAILVIVLLLRGTGEDSFTILGGELKNLRTLLKWIFLNEKDDVLKMHAEEGLAELDIIVKTSLLKKTPLIKEIRILDPI